MAMRTVWLMALFAVPVASSKYPIQKLGTADMSVVETTPVVWKGELLRFESVRGNYNSPTYPVPSIQPSPCPGQSCFRFRNVATLAVTPPFATNCSFGCAYVQKGSSRTDGVDTMWAFGNCADQKQQNVSAFSSTDLNSWTAHPKALELTGFGHTSADYKFFNTNVHDDMEAGTHVMAIELGAPHDITGSPFTSVFARHTGNNLGEGWVLLDPHQHVWPPIAPAHGYEGACPTIRYVKATGYYYVFTLWGETGGYGEHVQRSKDLISWEESKGNPMLDWQGQGGVPADKGKPPRTTSKYYFTNFTSEQESFVAKSEDINNSDIDFCEVGGDIYISYSWGDQRGQEFLGAAVVKGVTTDEWLASFFSDDANSELAASASASMLV